MELPLSSERERKKKEIDEQAEEDKTGSVAFVEYSSVHSKALQ
jgi:hypothetical protein